MSLKGSEPREVEPPLPMMEMIDDDKDRNGGKKFSNNGRKPRGNTDFDYFDTNSGGDTDILSQTSDDSSVSELVLKIATTEKKHKKVSLHSCVSNPDQEELGCDNSSESDLENSQPVLKKAKKYVRKINNKKKTAEHSSVAKADQEVSAINLSSKSAKS